MSTRELKSAPKVTMTSVESTGISGDIPSFRSMFGINTSDLKFVVGTFHSLVETLQIFSKYKSLSISCLAWFKLYKQWMTIKK